VTDPSTNRFIKKALDSRSRPYVWLRKNYAEIAAAIAAQTRPPWTALAKAAADDGKLFTPDTLRKTWQRLERDLARGSASKTHVSSSPPPEPQPKPPANLPPDTADDGDNPFGFKLGAHPKRWTKPD
jgi:hypothetical protein